MAVCALSGRPSTLCDRHGAKQCDADRLCQPGLQAIVLQQAASADQQFYTGHCDFPVECIAVAPDMQSVASITFSDQEQLQIQVPGTFTTYHAANTMLAGMGRDLPAADPQC